MMRWISGGTVVRVDFPATITDEVETLYGRLHIRNRLGKREGAPSSLAWDFSCRCSLFEVSWVEVAGIAYVFDRTVMEVC